MLKYKCKKNNTLVINFNPNLYE